MQGVTAQLTLSYWYNMDAVLPYTTKLVIMLCDVCDITTVPILSQYIDTNVHGCIIYMYSYARCDMLQTVIRYS
jgi:hypothetical protein